jgi:two-component system response regulator DesR
VVFASWALVIRLLLGNDQLMFRDAVKGALEAGGDISVVAEVSRVDQVVEGARRHGPDIALIDIEMAGGDALDTAREVTNQVPSCRVLMLTAHARPGFLQRALSNGAMGLVIKDEPIATLVTAIRLCSQGHKVVRPELAASAMSLGPSPLTPGERGVLVAVTSGASVIQIAKTLHLSEGTVRNRISEALSKLYARNRIDAVRIATENGWL